MEKDLRCGAGCRETVRHVTHGRNCLLRRPEFKADDSEATASLRPERAREQQHGWKAGDVRRRVWHGPATPARYGESCIARTVRHITESRILLTEEGGTEEQTSGSPNLPDGESLRGP